MMGLWIIRRRNQPPAPPVAGLEKVFLPGVTGVHRISRYNHVLRGTYTIRIDSIQWLTSQITEWVSILSCTNSPTISCQLIEIKYLLQSYNGNWPWPEVLFKRRNQTLHSIWNICKSPRHICFACYYCFKLRRIDIYCTEFTQK